MRKYVRYELGEAVPVSKETSKAIQALTHAARNMNALQIRGLIWIVRGALQSLVSRTDTSIQDARKRAQGRRIPYVRRARR